MVLIVKKNNDSRGVFTDRPYETKDVVLKFPGQSLTAEQVSKLTKEQQGNVLQIGADNYLDLTGETAFFCNHHCNPNCYVKCIVNNAFLIALRPIEKDEEITFDYSLTSRDTEETWFISCTCHKYYCRKIISGFGTIPKEKQKEMTESGIVPRYIKR